MQSSVLVVASDRRLIEQLCKWLDSMGYAVDAATDADAARKALAGRAHETVFCACELEDATGRFLLPQLARQLEGCALIGLGLPPEEAFSRNLIGRSVLECLRLPLQRGELLLAMKRTRLHLRVRGRAQILNHEAERWRLRRPLVAATSPMIRLMEEIEESAAFDTPVLVVGEYGVGKESVARTIHAHGSRRHAAFLRVDAAGLRASDLETLLVGRSDGRRERGRLLERARGGTLFFDCLGGMPADTQRLLAQQLAPKPDPQATRGVAEALDLRVMASIEETDGPVSPAISDEVRAVFRGSRLRVPPLRERRADIPLLVDHFLGLAEGRARNRLPALTGSLLTKFSEHPWPGNLRELENVIERSVLMAKSRELPQNQILAACLIPAESRAAGHPEGSLALRPARREFERALILRALKDCKGNRTHAARKLAISHRALLYKLKSHDISKD